MEVEEANPSEINRVHMNKKHLINFVDLHKKRKLQAEQLGLPVAKHKCSDGSLPSKSLSMFDENPEVEDFHKNIINEIAEAGATDDESEQESAKDSNSFQEDSDATMSIYGESKYELDNVKTWLYNRPSSSSDYWASSSSKDNYNSSDGTAVAGVVGIEHHPFHHVDGLHVAENLDEPLNEYYVNYLCSGYVKDSIEQSMDEEIEDIPYSNEVNPNMYVLSSGRWSSKQDAEQGKRKPTIDQEFEQYFSTLMM